MRAHTYIQIHTHMDSDCINRNKYEVHTFTLAIKTFDPLFVKLRCLENVLKSDAFFFLIWENVEFPHVHQYVTSFQKELQFHVLKHFLIDQLYFSFISFLIQNTTRSLVI